MKLLTIAIAILLGTLFTGGCARDLVNAPETDYSVPPLLIFGRMLEKDELDAMPDYERNQEVCKRTDAAFRRVDQLNDIADRITATGNDLGQMQRSAYSCKRAKVADCINCTPYWIETCGAVAKPPEWDRTASYRKLLVGKYRSIEQEHLKAHKACVSYIQREGMNIDELFALHKSALEPPEFLPTPTQPELEMAEWGWEP